MTDSAPPGLQAPAAPDGQRRNRRVAAFRHQFHADFHADAPQVRAVLMSVAAWLAAAGVGPDQAGTVELVLAEVLNNIVEHAYGPEGGQVTLRLRLVHDRALCAVTDHGRPMPGGRIPDPPLPQVAPPDHLPEGGWGWHLVHLLTTKARYARRPGANHLRLRLLLT